jgi:hypothetical protein
MENMVPLHVLIGLFCSQLALGTLSFLPVVKRREIGSVFYRIILGITASILLIALIFPVSSRNSLSQWFLWTSFGLMLLSFALTYRDEKLSFKQDWPQWGAILLASLIGLAGIALQAKFFSASSKELWWMVFNFGTSSLLLGSILMAMLVGHYYLIRYGLSIRPLKILAGIFIALLVVKTLMTAGVPLAFPESRELLVSIDGIFLWMRIAWGLAGPLGLSYLIWNTVKIRSTQSATGILYVAVFCLLVGEALSKYLVLTHKLPL